MSGYLMGAIPTLLGVIAGSAWSRLRTDRQLANLAARLSRARIADSRAPTTAELTAGVAR